MVITVGGDGTLLHAGHFIKNPRSKSNGLVVIIDSEEHASLYKHPEIYGVALKKRNKPAVSVSPFRKSVPPAEINFINPVHSNIPPPQPNMDFFASSKAKKEGKRSSGLFSKKTVSKSNPTSPLHPSGSTSPPPPYLSNKRADMEYDFPISDQQRPHWKQPASERIPNSHPKPPVYGYGTPEHRQDHGRERIEAMSYEPEANALSSPFHPAGNRPPERPRKSTEYIREHHDRMYEADTRSIASPFHPFRSPSPSPYRTPDRRRDHNGDQYEAVYDPEANNMLQNSAPARPYHPAGSRSPPPYRTPGRYSNHDKEQFEELYERDGDVTPRNRSRSSPFHPAAHRTPDHRSNHHGKEQIEDFYGPDDDVTPGNSFPPSPFNPAARHSPPQPYRAPEHCRNHQDNDPFKETMYEADGDMMPRNSAPPSPVHGPHYSSSEDDNHSTYLYPEIRTPVPSTAFSENSTPVHHDYQIVAVETYEEDKQFEPPELPDESQSFTMQEIAKMRGLKDHETRKEENQSMITEAYVTVANYRVRQSVSETLQAIIDKHGDIGASSKLQSVATRSYYLESLAMVVMELKSKVLRDLTKTRVAEIAAMVKDMESVRIDVTWLKTAVEELKEAVEYLGKYEEAKKEREVWERDVREKKGEMEEMTGEMVKREKEIKECREKVTMVAGRLGQLEMKGSKLKKNLDLFHSKLHKFQGEAVLLHL